MIKPQTSVVKIHALSLVKESLVSKRYEIRKGRSVLLSIATFRYMVSPSPLFNGYQRTFSCG